MDNCDDIFNLYETEGKENADGIFEIILQEFLSVTRRNINFSDCETATEKVKALKRQIYSSGNARLFFELLTKYGYNMKREIVDAMFALGHLENPNKNKEIIKKILKSPVIQDINFNGKNKFIISSEQYGDFVFQLASYYFRKNKKMSDYIASNVLPCRCHDHAYFMSQIFDDFYAITSLCRLYFENLYYHSYTFDERRNMIIDLCYNAIVDRDSYYNIFEPQDISAILNSEVQKELFLANQEKIQPVKRCPLLKIALYKQLQEFLRLQTDFEKESSVDETSEESVYTMSNLV